MWRKRKRSEEGEGSTSLTIYSTENPIQTGPNLKARRIRISQTEAINKLAKLLVGKFHKGVLVDKHEKHVIFNICTQLKIDDINSVTKQSFVRQKDTRFYCNQYSLVFEIGLNLDGAVKPGQSSLKSKALAVAGAGTGTGPALDWVSLREFAKSESFDSPPINSCIGFIPPPAYEALNSLLEIIHFVLFTARVDIQESLYQTKKPYYNIIVQLAPNQTLKVLPLLQIKQLGLDRVAIKTIALVFDKGSNALKVIVRVQLRG